MWLETSGIKKSIEGLWRYFTKTQNSDPQKARSEYMAKGMIMIINLFSALWSGILVFTFLIGISDDNLTLLTALLFELLMLFLLVLSRIFPKHIAYILLVFFFIFSAIEVVLYGINLTILAELSMAILMSVVILSARVRLIVLGVLIFEVLILGHPTFTLYDDGNLDLYYYRVFVVVAFLISVHVLLGFIVTEFKKAINQAHEYSQKLEDQIREKEIITQQLISAKRKSEESRKAAEETFANMSHELRTPMNAVIGLTRLLLDTKLDTQQVKYVKTLNLSAENILSIINEILDFSKVQSGKIEINKKQFNLKKLVKNLMNSMKVLVGDGDVELVTEINSTVPTRLFGDSARLNQVLSNLVSNAIKFTDQGKVSLKISCLEKTDQDVELQIVVSDTGIGIAPENVDKIFESFRQEENEVNRAKGGTGLGLSIVKKIVTAQGGEIYLSSMPKKGSVFTVRMRYDLISNIPEHNDFEHKKGSGPKLKGVKVILVEDNHVNQMVAKGILVKWGIDLTIADDGKKALELMRKNKYDLVLMDLKMPVLNGYETTRRIRNSLPSPAKDIPIIAMSAHVLTEEKERAVREGMNGYVTKPFTPEVLYNKMVQVMYR